MLSAKISSVGNLIKIAKKANFLSDILRVLNGSLFLYTRTRVGGVFMLVLLSMTFASGVYLPTGTALAESGSSTNYRLDYGRFTNDSDQKTSASYTLTDSISDISVEGDSPSYALRNVYSAPTVAGGPFCGNGIIETGEQCEGVNFNGLSCFDYGFNSGTLQCVNCQIVTTSCFDTGGGGGGGGGGFICGNGIREASEQCDDGNSMSGDGCSAYCFIETIFHPEEPTPEEPTPEEPTPEEPAQEPEPPLIFEPGFDPDLVFDFPGTGSDLEPLPETPIIRPAAPKDPTTSQIPIPKIEVTYDFHFGNYRPGQIVTILDETPFVVTQADPNAVYEMIIFDENDQVITRQGVKSTPNGVLMFEGIPFLEYKTYGIALFDQNRELFKAWTISIEDQKYQQHDNLYANNELNREYIALGSFKEMSGLSGKGKPKTQYHAYLQTIERQGNEVSEITHITAQADEHGNYKLVLPENLKDGSYLMHVVQVYEDGKVSRNKRYVFDLNNPDETKNLWVLLAILIILGIGKSLKKEKRQNGFKVRTLLSAFIAMSLIGHQSVAFAAVTTPAVFIYEGKLLDNTNTPITTAQTFRLSLWNSDDLVVGDITGIGAINPLAPAYGGWFETHTVTPNTDGTFFLELGSVTPLPNMLLTTHTHLMVEIKASATPDTSYEMMDPTGDNGADTDDRQTVGSTPYTNNADFIDNAELGTSAGDIATLSFGDIWDINYIPGGTNADSWTVDVNDTVGAGGTINLIFGTTLAEFLRFDIANDWFSFSNDVNFNQNEIKNVAIDNLAAAPGAPVPGQIYHNTTDGNSYVWNGVAWDDITAGASGTDDLDTVYSADADKKMAVNNAAGLEFESTVAGDIIVDLQNTGDFVIQDAGTPFAIFTDGGYFGVGNTSPISVFHIDSNAANTTAIATFENTAGDLQFFRSDATPEGSITGSVGDLAIDGTNGSAYIKNSGTATNTGWLQFGGTQGKTAVYNAEYADATITGDGTSNKGLLSSYFTDGGGTSKYNYYEWTTRETAMQDVDITISFRLPKDFQNFTATPLSILYQTSDAVLATNQIDVTLYDTTGTAVALTGGTDLASGAWTTAGITFGGVPTFTAGEIVTLIIKPQTTSAGHARVSDVIFNYNGS